MRMEMAQLQNKSEILKNQLSQTMLKSAESIQDMHRYASENVRLENEIKTLATNIQYLELKIVGDSNLSPNNCTIEDILTSISKITKSFETKQLKNMSLEKTLLKVRSSFQLVVDKADKEKKYIDEEKLKLLNEKEDAIKELQNVEKEITEMKEKYETQLSHERSIINDLGAEISNQNLIINKMNKSKDEIISKLEGEIESLQEMYKTSILKVNELQGIIHEISAENDKNLIKINETNISLKEKSKEIENLKKLLENLKHKSVQSVCIQSEVTTPEYNHKLTQTCNEQWYEKIIFEPVALETVQKLGIENSKDIVMSDILPKNEPYSQNEVQILRANVDVGLIFDSPSDYISGKMQRLNLGPVETYSISSFRNVVESSNEKSVISEDSKVNKTVKTNHIKPVNISSSSLCDLKNHTDNETKYLMSIKKNKSDNDLSVVYKESNSNNNSPMIFENEVLEIYNKERLQQINEIPKTYTKTTQNKKKKWSKNNSIPQNKEDRDVNKVSIKPRLQIDMPRVGPESSSIINPSDADNKSIDSYTYANHSSPQKSTYSDTNVKNKQISSNVPFSGSSNTLDKLSREVKIHDIFFHGKDNNNRGLQSDNRLPNKIDERVGSGQFNSPHVSNTTSMKTPVHKSDSNYKLSRVGSNGLLVGYTDVKSVNNTLSPQPTDDSEDTLKSGNFGLQYILETLKRENDQQNVSTYNNIIGPKNNFNKKNLTLKKLNIENKKIGAQKSFNSNSILSENYSTSIYNNSEQVIRDQQKSFSEVGVLVKMDSFEDYENKIHYLTKALEHTERDCKKKIEAVKIQYDNNIKNIINDHNQGVKSIQSLHEETFQDVIKIHENEVENLRSMGIEALRKVEKLEKENFALKTKIYKSDSAHFYDNEEPIKIPTPDIKKRREGTRIDTRTLTTTNVEAFNVKPKSKSHGPCTCSVNMNISDTIRNIFEQVNTEQRKMAESAYLKYIANKISSNNLETLDAQELSFLHLKVCRLWKTKLSKEEALQKRIESLESEVINKQSQAQEHLAEIDRKVAEERRHLEELREAVCRNSPKQSRDGSPESTIHQITHAGKNLGNFSCICNQRVDIAGRRSAGDLGTGLPAATKGKRTKIDMNRAALTKLDTEERRDRKFYDDPPIRLKRSHDRPPSRKK